MAKDVIITPLSGLVDFQSSSTSQATIELDDSNNLKLSSSGGTVQIGNASSDVYIGTGAATVDIIFQQDGSVRGTGSETICLGLSGDNIVLPSGVDLSIGTTSTAQNATTTHMGNMSFGLPGNGTNTCARFLSIEGNTDASGEGSGRIFFTEHNSTTASMSKYGMSIGYRGGGVAVTGADGNVWCGLNQIGNGQWGMWGHDNSVDGSLIMYGDRGATFVCFNNNNVRTSTCVFAGQFIDNDNNSCLVNPSATSYINCLYLNGNAHRFQVGHTCNTSSADTIGLHLHGNYTSGQYAHRLRKYDHGGGVPLYIDSSGGTANVFSACARFGTYTGNSNAFEVFGNSGVTGQLCITSASTSSGNIYFSAANPYIKATSYIIMPGGLYVSGGTAYFSNATMHRGGVCRDNATYLQISGGTGCDTYFPGQIGIGTTDPIHALHVQSGSVFIGEAAYCSSSCTNSNGKLLNFDNSYDSSQSIPANKIRMHTTATWLGGIGICSNTVAYHSGTCHRWFTGSTCTSYGSVGMTLDSCCNLTVSSCIIAGNCLAVGAGNSGYLRDITGQYGSIEVDGNSTGGWEGYSIGGRIVFMHDNDTASGIYNDVDNEWLFYGLRNADVRLYHNGTARICTTGSGACIIGTTCNTSFGGSATYSKPLLEITSGATPTQIKITTSIPYSGASASTHAHTVTVRGFQYGSAQTVDLQISWHVYNNSFYNRSVTSSGSWAPVVTLAVENNYVVIHLASPGYWPKMYVESLYNAYGGGSHATGWSWSDAAISADTDTPNQTVPYKINFGVSADVKVGSCTVWHSGNDGGGSGLDADTLDGLQASYFGVGDHFKSIGSFNLSCGTTTACVMAQLENNNIFDSYVGALKTGWSYASNCDLTDAGRLTELAGTSWLTWTDNSSDSTRGNITALVIAPNTGGSANKAFIYNDQGSGYSPGWREIWTNASDGSGSGLDADLLDGQHGSYYSCANNLTGTYCDLFSCTTRYCIGLIDGNSTQTRDKIRVWGAAEYSIGMCSGYTYGALNNQYAMSFQMNNDSGRGFWWGDTAHTAAQGAMSLTTHGHLTVACRIKVGGGESTTIGPSYPLHVIGEGHITGNITTCGNVGIGTTDPGVYDLAVVGTSCFASNMFSWLGTSFTRTHTFCNAGNKLVEITGYDYTSLATDFIGGNLTISCGIEQYVNLDGSKIGGGKLTIRNASASSATITLCGSTGAVCATCFVGDGSNLTNLPSNSYSWILEADSSSSNGTINNLHRVDFSGGCNIDTSHSCTSNPSRHTVTIAYNTSSDHRLKECVEYYDSGYNVVKAVPTYNYNFNECYKGKSTDQITCRVGMMAHELQEGGQIQGVTGSKDQVDEDNNPIYQKVHYDELVPTLWSALRKSIEKIEQLEETNNTLIDRITKLEQAVGI